eukprot:TRINITY_DN5964_c0_g1_i1.p1 TRINITY_DN5964_c0_g1~~TRINITY_DN5964_c0_g1_i1.p1  ORF type:complete len:175 (-),score=9.97 TRINITY_DN5964_c0_g1_i1:86-610(-)
MMNGSILFIRVMLILLCLMCGTVLNHSAYNFEKDIKACNKTQEGCVTNSSCCQPANSDFHAYCYKNRPVREETYCCLASNATCEDNEDCCSGNCTKETCSICKANGLPCNSPEECCDGECNSYVTGGVCGLCQVVDLVPNPKHYTLWVGIVLGVALGVIVILFCLIISIMCLGT